VGGGGFVRWARPRGENDICTLLSLQYLGREGGGRVGRKQYLTIEVFQYMFLLYYFIKAMGWGGEVISRKGIQYIHLYTAISREKFFQYMFILYYCICRYIYIPPPPHPFPTPSLFFLGGGGGGGGGGWMWLIKTILLIYFA
jgi:hypothetical protein